MFSWIADRLYITRTYSYFFGAAVLAAMAALHGCSGGGGDGGGGGGNNGPSYSLSSSSVSFSANRGGVAPPPQVVTVTVTSGTLFVKTSQTGNAFGHTFSSTSPTTGQITITPGVTFNAGTFSGATTVHACTDASCQNDIAGSPKTIDVTYTVTGLGVAPTAINFESTTGQAAAPQDVTLSLTPGGSASWTSSVNYTSGTSGWLTLGPANGSIDSPQTVSLIVNAAVSAEVRTATVTFTAGALTQNVAVTYTISPPRVDFVAPYVAASNVDGSVILRGHGFFSLNPPTTVQFANSSNSTQSSALILSDTEIQAVYSGLTAGSYDITVSDGATTLTTRSGVKLLVVDPLPPSAAATIARSAGSEATDLIYDAERRALYLMDQQANRLERHQFNGTTWALTLMPFAGGGTTDRRITLSPDGTLLLKTSGDSSLLTRIDTATFAALPGSDDAAPIGSTALNRIAFANDGTAIGNSAGATALYRYDMLTRQFVTLGTDLNLLKRHIAASSDGDTLVLTSELLSSGGAILTYDASNGTLTERTAGNATDLDNDKVSISRDGSRILLISPDPSGGGNRPVVYDASFTVLGRLPVGLNGFVVKPDGSAAYGYYPGTTSVRKFDLTQPPDGNGIFPEEPGSETVVASPGTSSTAMTMSPDGTALFLAGNQKVIVLSAP
jgi:hypothetical protein